MAARNNKLISNNINKHMVVTRLAEAVRLAVDKEIMGDFLEEVGFVEGGVGVRRLDNSTVEVYIANRTFTVTVAEKIA